LLHASAVARGGRAAVFAGTSGAGKSTTALACVVSGMEFLGDDACLLDVAVDGAPVVHPVYGFAKLEADAVDRMPRLGQLPASTPGDSAVVDPGAHRGNSAPLGALFLPRVTGGRRTRSVRIGAGDAMRTLVQTSVMESGGAVRTSLGILGAAVRRVPCF